MLCWLFNSAMHMRVLRGCHSLVVSDGHLCFCSYARELQVALKGFIFITCHANSVRNSPVISNLS